MTLKTAVSIENKTSLTAANKIYKESDCISDNKITIAF